MKYILPFIIGLGVYCKAQTVHPNDIRISIYQQIIKDINSNLPQYPIKQIFLDESVPKYNEVNMTTDGIVLNDPQINLSKQICNYLSLVQCVTSHEINNYQLSKIYQNHLDTEHPDFYGIYSPIDQWHQLILNGIRYQMLNNKPEDTKLYIPVKHQYFFKDRVMEEILMYSIILDKDFKISYFTRLKL